MRVSEYTVRPARAEEIPLLPAIEQAAANLFGETEYAFLVNGETLPLHFLQAQQAQGLVWVAVDGEAQPVGFAVARPLDGALYLHEIDVHPLHGRRGVGKRLVHAVVAHACGAGYDAVTLSTFADLAWNAPFYAYLGFRTMSAQELTPGLREVQRKEVEAAMPMEARVCMCLSCR